MQCLYSVIGRANLGSFMHSINDDFEMRLPTDELCLNRNIIASKIRMKFRSSTTHFLFVQINLNSCHVKKA